MLHSFFLPGGSDPYVEVTATDPVKERIMYSFPIITNDYGFLYEFAFKTNGYIKVLDPLEDLGLCDRFELCYLEQYEMLEAKDILHQMILKG